MNLAALKAEADAAMADYLDVLSNARRGSGHGGLFAPGLSDAEQRARETSAAYIDAKLAERGSVYRVATLATVPDNYVCCDYTEQREARAERLEELENEWNKKMQRRWP